MYPNAKVVLTTRSAESWSYSAYNTIFAIFFSYRNMNNWWSPPLRFMKPLVPVLSKLITLADVMWYPMFENVTKAEHMVPIFNDWEASVEAHVPKERLLKFSVKEGGSSVFMALLFSISSSI